MNKRNPDCRTTPLSIASSKFLPLVLILAWVSSRGSVSFGQETSSTVKVRAPAEYRQFAMQNEGDAVPGGKLFADEQRLACSKCHSVDGRGLKAGPDLVETKSGDAFQGVLKQVTDDWIELMGGDGLRVRIVAADVREQHGSGVSLMPDGLQAGLSRQEFTDLIEYLVSLKQPDHALTTYQGMPETIPQLTRPVILRPR